MAGENKNQADQIENLHAALAHAQKRIAKELERIGRLRGDSARERNARERAEKRIREVRLQLTPLETSVL